jgi:putative phage-type endonuclease
MTQPGEQLFHVVDLEQGSQEWLEWRHSGIGASDASTVMSDNRFQSPSELLYEKKNKINTEPNEKMKLGTALESDARDLYIEKKGHVVKPLCLQSKKYSWLIASMDGITDDFRHIVEIKCGESAYWQANKGKVPSYYYGQLQHQLLITGLDTVDYWCYWPGHKGILQTVNRDESYIRRLLQAEMEFMEILNGEIATQKSWQLF